MQANVVRKQPRRSEGAGHGIEVCSAQIHSHVWQCLTSTASKNSWPT